MIGVPAVKLEGLSREEWLAARRQGIGGSDVAAILGLDKWNSPYSLYLDKVGEGEERADNSAMEWGRRLEDVVARAFADETGWVVKAPTHIYAHPEYPWMLANPDRFLYGDFPHETDGEPASLLEVKTSGSKDAWADGVPEHYELQVQHYLAVTGLPQAWVAVLLNGREFRTFQLYRDEGLIRTLIDAERDFWERVQNQDPPPVDGHEATTEAVKRQFAVSHPDSIDVGPAVLKLREERRIAKTVMDEAKADIDQIDNAVKVLLRDYEVGLVGDEKVVTWKSQSKRSLDAKKLEAEYPDVYRDCMGETSFRVLRWSKEAS